MTGFFFTRGFKDDARCQRSGYLRISDASKHEKYEDYLGTGCA
ncbi:MAG: hypothetical protein ACYDHX_12640 [Methanothrix sp.]